MGHSTSQKGTRPVLAVHPRPISSVSSVLAFISTTGRGFQVEYPAITLHAISRTEAGPSIYCQLDETPAGDQTDGDHDDSPMRELKIVPERVEAREFSLTFAGSTGVTPNADQFSLTVEPIFEAMSSCAALHPDSEVEIDGNDDAFVDASNFEAFDGDVEQELSQVGRVRSDFANDNRYAPY